MRLDGFNEHLLAGHQHLGGIPSRFLAGMAWGVAGAGVIAISYLAAQQGWFERFAGTEEAVVISKAETRPIRVQEAKNEATVRETERVSVQPARNPSPRPADKAELDRLLAKLGRMEANSKPSEAAQVLESKPAVKTEPPILVGRAKPAPKPAPRVTVVPAEEPQVRPVEAKVLAEAVAKSGGTKQESLLLFKKQEEAPVAVPAVSLPTRPVVVKETPVSVVPVKPEVSMPAVARKPAVPILLVEETGVRVIGPEGERFIPVGGKLNGKHILATSPKIGLIVTEDSAIRVNNNQER